MKPWDGSRPLTSITPSTRPDVTAAPLLKALYITTIPAGPEASGADGRMYVLVDGDVAVAVNYTPPGSDAVRPLTRYSLDRALADWAETADTLGLKPWLVYMPCKRRVLHDRLRFIDETPQEFVDWRPTDLPAYMEQRADSHGIGFIDVTPVLLRETRQGRLTYNPIWDTHLNRLGTALVAQAIADTLRKHLE